MFFGQILKVRFENDVKENEPYYCSAMQQTDSLRPAISGVREGGEGWRLERKKKGGG
jgi:hypothetical protein